MRINMAQIRNETGQLFNGARNLLDAAMNLSRFQRELNAAWVGSEVNVTNHAIDDYARRAKQLSHTLEMLGIEIQRIAEIIRMEDENNERN